ncbi:MAG: S1/P1 nuclease [Legionellales bacterium]|jgi:hypothetical protein|nr:S1/P1 nuclease [Legionellales bacterium]
MKKQHLFFLFILLNLNFCYAWGQTGHRVVGKIAENHLSPTAKKTIYSITHGVSLAELSTWLDDIKSDKDYKKYTTWHYMEITDAASSSSVKKSPKGNLIYGISFAIDALKHKGKDDVEPLAILVHLIGDLHQPLHVGNGIDRGANGCMVNWFGKNRRVNLHRVWDSYLINNRGLSYTELAGFIDNIDDEKVSEIQKNTPVEWALESRKLHDDIYPESLDNNWHSYCHASSGQKVPTISYKYIYHNKDLLNERLLKAGVRLAGILNSIYS